VQQCERGERAEEAVDVHARAGDAQRRVEPRQPRRVQRREATREPDDSSQICRRVEDDRALVRKPRALVVRDAAARQLVRTHRDVNQAEEGRDADRHRLVVLVEPCDVQGAHEAAVCQEGKGRGVARFQRFENLRPARHVERIKHGVGFLATDLLIRRLERESHTRRSSWAEHRIPLQESRLPGCGHGR